MSPGFLHVEDSASRLGGLQQGVPPGAQLDELCFGADLGGLGGAKLWLGGGVLGFCRLLGAIPRQVAATMLAGNANLVI